VEHIFDARTLSGLQPSVALDLMPPMQRVVVARRLVRRRRQTVQVTQPEHAVCSDERFERRSGHIPAFLGILDYRTVIRTPTSYLAGGIQMIRHAALVAVLVCGSPSWLYAQSTEFTVNAAPADVHKGPSMVNPVIGKAPRGTVLEVTRELGSWVRIAWPSAEDGVGYVHMSMGRISQASTSPSDRTAGPKTTSITAGRTAPESQSPSPATAGGQSNGPGNSASLTPTTHFVGLGARMGGSTVGFGASARASVHDRFGIQLEVSRYAPASAVAQPRLTSLQFAPSLLYSLPDKLTDYLWLRPYIGAGVAIYRSTLSGGTAGGDSVTDSRLGRQVFGGTEVTFASLPRFTLSADYGYRWHQAPFSGFELGGPGLSVSGHWYVK
jgi:hypothetical protein